ncbi:hypothetical protein R1flu_006475 [Riccia fluitans]|uniref:Rhodanese domain-containing protein n=1 Tax=Riccia fluitans TaxID=41844 RepID=A0ABD1YW43_9MARC
MATAIAKCSTVAIAQASQSFLWSPANEVRSHRVLVPCQAAGGLRVSPDTAQLQRRQNHKSSERRAFTVTSEATQTKTPKTPAETEWKIKREALLKAKVRSVSPSDALRLQQEHGYTIIDVRTEFEFNQAHPAGAVNIQVYRLIKEWTAWDIARRAAFAFFGIFQGTEENPEFLNEVKSQFSKDSKIIVGCIAGGTLKPSPNLAEGSQSRSLIAAYLLTLEGYTNIVHMEGGIKTWFKDQLPTESVVEK